MRIILSPGQRGDVPFADALIDGLRPDHVIADRADDANHFRLAIALAGASAVIPSRPDRARRLPCDFRLYRERYLVERRIDRLEQFRRVATRYDKLLANYRGFVVLAAICLWLR